MAKIYLKSMIEEEHRDNVESAFNRIGKQQVKFAHSEMHWGCFLVIHIFKINWNQHINSEVDKIKYILIITFYLIINFPSHIFFF